MITSWDIYWITRLDGLNFFVGVIAVISIITATTLLIIRIASDDYFPWEHKFIKTWFRPMFTAVIVAVMCIVISIFVPSTKEAVAIYMIPKIVNNEQVQKLPDNAMKFLNGKLEEWIAGMSSSLEKKK